MNKEKNNIRVLFAGRYNESEVLSGPEKVAKRIFSEYTRSEPSLFVEYFFDGSRYGFLSKLFGRQVVREDPSFEIVRAGIFRILPLLFSFKPDIIHIITYERFAVVLLLYKLFSRVKVIYNAHGIITRENISIRKVSFFYRLKDRICEKLFMRYSDRIVFYSETSINLAEKYFKLDETKLVILSSGVDTVFNRTFQSRNHNNSASLKVVIMSDGQFINRGLGLLKEIVRLIKSPVEINLIGNVMSSSFGGVDGLVTFRFLSKMDTSHLADFYKDKDVYLSLRNYETFSIAAVEAMASGLVPVVSKETGMSRYILNGENGYILSEVDAPEISDRINLLAGNSGLRHTLSANSSKVYELLSWEQIFDTFRSIYLELTD